MIELAQHCSLEKVHPTVDSERASGRFNLNHLFRSDEDADSLMCAEERLR